MSDPDVVGLVQFDPPETFAFNTHDWPLAALRLVSAACNRDGIALTADEAMRLVVFFGLMQRDKEQASR